MLVGTRHCNINQSLFHARTILCLALFFMAGDFAIATGTTPATAAPTTAAPTTVAPTPTTAAPTQATTPTTAAPTPSTAPPATTAATTAATSGGADTTAGPTSGAVTTASTTVNGQTTTTSEKDKKGKHNKGVIAAIIVIVLVALLAGLYAFYRRRYRHWTKFREAFHSLSGRRRTRDSDGGALGLFNPTIPPTDIARGPESSKNAKEEFVYDVDAYRRFD